MILELDTLLAQQACRDLVLAAAEAVDGRDFLALAAMFEPDGVLVRPDGVELSGRDAIVAAYAARDPYRLTRHLVSNQRVSVDLAAGTARATCSVLLWSGRHSDAATPRGRPADPVQQVGEIRDLLAKTPQGWRISRREAWFTLFQTGSTP
ncbi:nuclear transport factor 2 family protein [Hydrogenophaga sp. Root209]|uniref:nuclear transport factor 2 family protein n=1 Tax=Hydrogenophaga sp. Root209 TaxID=1736490 RepID=UPI0009EA31E8|nr:nuclear transport factor 2 family protein [Hydrogenophaga sp. Root209]